MGEKGKTGMVSVESLHKLAIKRNAIVRYYIVSTMGELLRRDMLPDGRTFDGEEDISNYSQASNRDRYLNYWWALRKSIKRLNHLKLSGRA